MAKKKNNIQNQPNADNWMENVEFNMKYVPEFKKAFEEVTFSLLSDKVTTILLQTNSNFFKSQISKQISSFLSHPNIAGKYRLFKVNAQDDITDDAFFEMIEKDLRAANLEDDQIVILYIDNILERLGSDSFKDFIDNLMAVCESSGISNVKLIATYEDKCEEDNLSKSVIAFYEKRYVITLISVDEPPIVDFYKIFGKQVFNYFYSDAQISKATYEYFICSFQQMHNGINTYSAMEVFLRDVDLVCSYCKYKGRNRISRSVIDAFYYYDRTEKTKEIVSDALHKTSVHEIGHTIVDFFLRNKFLFVTNWSDSEETEGTTHYSVDYTWATSMDSAICDATIDLGSMAAFMLCGYPRDAGMNCDLSKATKHIRNAIMTLGDDDEFGLYYCEKFSKLSDEKKRIVEKRTEDILNQCLENAIRIITEHRELFDALVVELEKKRILSNKEVEKLAKKYQN